MCVLDGSDLLGPVLHERLARCILLRLRGRAHTDRLWCGCSWWCAHCILRMMHGWSTLWMQLQLGYEWDVILSCLNQEMVVNTQCDHCTTTCISLHDDHYHGVYLWGCQRCLLVFLGLREWWCCCWGSHIFMLQKFIRSTDLRSMFQHGGPRRGSLRGGEGGCGYLRWYYTPWLRRSVAEVITRFITEVVQKN